jgi:small-conductance mechanosensitive channel/CRP-like cAMP-binding protein
MGPPPPPFLVPMGPLGLVPTWISAALGATLLLLLARTCRRRGLPALPLRLPLLALLAAVVVPAIPLGKIPFGSRLWLGAIDDLLLVYAGIRLAVWLALELPGGLGWWRRPPDLLLQLLMVGGSALGTVVVARQTARFDLVGLVTTSAVLTAVIGLAAQEPLKDLLAGLELQISEDFNLGDLLDIEGGARGVVHSVSWRNTSLRTMEGALVVVPNTRLTSGVMRNLSAFGPVSNRFEVGLAYDFPPGRARGLLLRVLSQHPLVLNDPAPMVRLKEVSESAITYDLQVWQQEASEQAIGNLRSELLEHIWYGLSRAGQSIPRAPTPEECREALAANDLFLGLTPEDLDRVLASSQAVSYAAGEAIVQEGARGESLYQLLRGRVTVLKQVQPGHTVPVAELGPGDVFGEMTLFQGAPRSATVRALEECHLLRVGRAGFRDLMERDPALVERFAALISERRAKLDSLSRDQRQEQTNALIDTMKRLFFAIRGG